MQSTAESAEIQSKEFLSRALTPLLHYKANFQIQIIHVTNESTVSVRMHADDHEAIFGTLIGNQHMKLSLERLVHEIGFKNRRRLRLLVCQPNIGEIEDIRHFKPALKWNSEPLRHLLADLCQYFIVNGHEIISEDMGDVTVFRVRIEEPFSMADHVRPKVEMALGTLFTAIGQVQGRQRVLVELSPK
jgi:hypothetical protein